MNRAAPVRAVVIDDHVLFRSGLRELLEQASVRVVGEASTAELGIEVIGRQQPDVAIVDLSLPHMSGIDAISGITAAAPHTQVLVLTVSTDESDMTHAVLAGACGYLLKDAPARDIVSGVLAAASGESMISPRMVTALLRHVRERMQTDRHATAAILTAREKEVLRLVVEGKDNAAIGQALFISQYTVKNHVSNILQKLHVENRLQAAVCAVRDSLV